MDFAQIDLFKLEMENGFFTFTNKVCKKGRISDLDPGFDRRRPLRALYKKKGL